MGAKGSRSGGQVSPGPVRQERQRSVAGTAPRQAGDGRGGSWPGGQWAVLLSRLGTHAVVAVMSLGAGDTSGRGPVPCMFRPGTVCPAGPGKPGVMGRPGREKAASRLRGGGDQASSWGAPQRSGETLELGVNASSANLSLMGHSCARPGGPAGTRCGLSPRRCPRSRRKARVGPDSMQPAGRA